MALYGGLLLLIVVAAIIVARSWRVAEPRRQPGLNVLLITIDTLRADALGAYGAPEGVTPWLDRLAAAGVRFEYAYAHNVVTLPSHANILSGRYPFDHGIRDNAGFRFPEDVETLATLLRRRGYRTGAFVSAFPVDSRFGLDRGFDVYEDGFVNVDTAPHLRLQERAGAETVALARRWLGESADEPSFCWVHLFEPHFPYAPPEPIASRYRANPYRGEVAASDAALAPLLEPLLRAGDGGRTLTIVTADHGEALGDHGERTHGIFAYQAVLRVPLIVHAPQLFGSRVVREPVRHVDLLPTVLDALALEVPANLPGRSLLRLAAGGEAEPEPVYFEALTGSLTRDWAPLRGVLLDHLKFIELPIPELYDLAQDPGEQRNLVGARAADRERLQVLLERLRPAEDVVEPVAEHADTAERLAALGYVSGREATKQRFTVDDDPKRLMHLDAQMNEVLRLQARGEFERAATLCEQVIQSRPEMQAPYLQLGYLRRAQGDLGAAIAALEKALALNRGDATTLSLLGAYLNEAGRAAEAADLLRPQLSVEPGDVDVLTALGMAEAQLGRTEAALAAFARARRLDPSNGMIRVNAATVLMMDHQDAAARSELEAALRLNPQLGRAHNALGVIAARQADERSAVEHWGRALAINPDDVDVLYNIGLTLARLGEAEQARARLQRFLEISTLPRDAPERRRVQRWLDSLPRAQPQR